MLSTSVGTGDFVCYNKRSRFVYCVRRTIEAALDDAFDYMDRPSEQNEVVAERLNEAPADIQRRATREA